MKLSYFELLSPEPVQIADIGGILSPTLRDISSLGYRTYQYYLTILLMDLKTYFQMAGQEEAYESLSDEEKSQISVFDLMTAVPESCELLQDVLNFFVMENVVFSPSHNGFIVQNDMEDVGIITRDNFASVSDYICQRNSIKSRQVEDLSKIKNKKALSIMKKIQKGRAERDKQTKADKDMELTNIISAVANKSHSLNILNIWDITVYQLWDCFTRISNNNIYGIHAMSVAAWGDKDNHFDASSWFKSLP